MKIGMVLWSGFPPDIRVKREAQYLTEYGHEVHIICRNSSDQPVREIKDDIYIHRIDSGDDFRYAVEELTRHMTLISPTWYKSLNNKISEENYDIIHVHDLLPLPTVLRVTKGSDTPIVADFHELFPEAVTEWRKSKPIREKLRPSILFKSSTRLKRVEAKCMREIEGLVTVSPEQLEYYREDYALSNVETAVVRNVPDLDRLKNIPIEPLDYDGFVVGYVGGFSPQRGLETAIKAFSEFLESVPNATLLMVGDSSDDYIDNVKNLCVDLGIEENVEFTGWVDFEKVPSYMNACHITLCPYTGENIQSEYALPNKIFQSMFVGAPVVASDLSAMSNLIGETNTGLTFETDSAPSLAESMIKLYNDSDLRKELSRNCKYTVNNKYNFRFEMKGLTELYKTIGS